LHNIFTSALFVFALLLPAFSQGEEDDYRKIKKLSAVNDSGSLSDLADSFIKKYPESHHLNDVLIISADRERDINKAIEKYKIHLKNGKLARDARKKICEIYFLQSSWHNLEKESGDMIRSEKNQNTEKAMLFKTASLINLEKYNEAKKSFGELLDATHEQKPISIALLYMAMINKKTSGFSSSYSNNLRDLASGFSNTDSYPSAVYLLGEYYENKNKTDEAYSAYRDLVEKYPKSPEAGMAQKRLLLLEKQNPKTVFYIPNKKIINDSESLDIRPELELTDDSGPHYYSIMIGPFSSKKKCDEMKRLLSDFGPSKSIKLGTGFRLIVGRITGADDALTAKIRLAEEFGINGRIVRISGDQNKKYIYGE
jgi:tetratricopeptide (TPR) repeat protein